MMTLKAYITISNLLYFILGIMPLIYLHIKYQKFRYEKPLVYATENAYQKYLDKYYITNKFYTLSCTISYIVIHLLILIAFRYYLLGTSGALIKIHGTLDSRFILLVVLKVVLFIIAFVLFNYVLNLFLFKEVQKLHIYFAPKLVSLWFYFDKYHLAFQDLIGPFYLFIDNIVHLNIELTDEYYDEHYEYRKIYTFRIIKVLHSICISLCMKSFLIHMMFKLLNRLLRLIFVHVGFTFLNYSFCYVILFFCLFYDIIYNKAFYYTYIGLLFTSIFKVIYKCHYYNSKNNSRFNRLLHNYFYNNESSYQIQRIYLIYDKQHIVFNSAENKALFKALKDHDSECTLKVYILNNLATFFKGEKEINSKINWMFIRFTLVIIAITLALYYLTHYNDYIITFYDIKMPNIMLIVPTILMYYLHINTFKKSPKQTVEQYFTYDYNKKLGILFWIITIMQLYIYWITIFKIMFLLLPEELLLSCYSFKIVMIFTMEYKLILFDTYYNYYAEVYGFKDFSKEMLDYYTLNNDFKETYCEILTAHDMKTAVNNLILNYQLHIIDFMNKQKQLADGTSVFAYFSLAISIYILLFKVLPITILSNLLHKQYEQFAQELLRSTFTIEMDRLAFYDLSLSFMTWLNKKESAYVILKEIIKYYIKSKTGY